MSFILFISSLVGYELNIAQNEDLDRKERPIVVCIPSFNNENYCEKCLKSVFSQDYSNFRLIYIDDASTDRTYEKVKAFISKNGYEDKAIVLSNKENMTMLYNHYTMAYMCHKEEIIVSLDGDDWFSTDDALARVNRAYSDPDVWVTYGQFKEVGSKYEHKPRPMYKHKLQPHIIRKMPFMFMQPRTYYAGLFQKIPTEYLLDDGKFYQTAGDVAIMLFLIDMARAHTYFIPEVIYSYNNENPINDFKVDRRNQLRIENLINTTPPLNALDSF